MKNCMICKKVIETFEPPETNVTGPGGECMAMCGTCRKAWIAGMKAGMEGMPITKKEDDAPKAEEKCVGQYQRISEFNMTPKEIISELDRRIVGQAGAKKSLALAVRRHYRRVQVEMIDPVKGEEMPKENILLIGPTGSGKTLLAQTLSEIVSVPLWKQSMMNFTEAGYVGNDVETLLSSLLLAAGKYLPLAERSMLFMDEIDKKAQRSTGHLGAGAARDVSGTSVQQALLEIIDPSPKGNTINVAVSGISAKGHPMRTTVPFCTKNLLIMMGGCFDGLSDIVAKRIGRKRKMGFSTDALPDIDSVMEDVEVLHHTTHDDLIEFGFIEEFCGRIGMIVILDPLSESELKTIMTDIDGSVIKRLQLLADVEGFSLEFSEEFIDRVVRSSHESGMGARRLSGITTQCVEDIFLELPDVVRERGGKVSVKVLPSILDDPKGYEVS